MTDTTKPYGIQWYCGCCGRPLNTTRNEASLWCSPCTRHLAPGFYPQGQRREPWERTYFAQFHTDCPRTEQYEDVQ